MSAKGKGWRLDGGAKQSAVRRGKERIGKKKERPQIALSPWEAGENKCLWQSRNEFSCRCCNCSQMPSDPPYSPQTAACQRQIKYWENTLKTLSRLPNWGVPGDSTLHLQINCSTPNCCLKQFGLHLATVFSFCPSNTSVNRLCFICFYFVKSVDSSCLFGLTFGEIHSWLA